jgi:hypothetical protein
MIKPSFARPPPCFKVDGTHSTSSLTLNFRLVTAARESFEFVATLKGSGEIELEDEDPIIESEWKDLSPPAGGV